MSKRTYMRGWSRHYQSEWLLRAQDPRLVRWLRVSAYAFATHRANGHAPLQAQELAKLLGEYNRMTGEVVPLESRRVSEAIADAKDHGWIDRRSSARCLIVHEYAIAGGLGSPDDICPCGK